MLVRRRTQPKMFWTIPSWLGGACSCSWLETSNPAPPSGHDKGSPGSAGTSPDPIPPSLPRKGIGHWAGYRLLTQPNLPIDLTGVMCPAEDAGPRAQSQPLAGSDLLSHSL